MGCGAAGSVGAGCGGGATHEAAGMRSGWGLAAWGARRRLDRGVRGAAVLGVRGAGPLGKDGACSVLGRTGC